MGVWSHNITFYGLPAHDWRPGVGGEAGAEVAPRLRLDWDDYEKNLSFGDLFTEFLSHEKAGETKALIIGMFGGFEGDGDSAEVVERLVSFADRLPALEALFVGEIVAEENEISWIQQTDMAPIWGAFPALRHFQVRGAGGLALGSIIHAKLETLIVESGGLPVGVVREALGAQTPELTHLELWLGDENYGSSSSVEDFEALFSGALFPKLKSLALRNCEFADELAAAIADAPLMERIETLDLSLGVLGDAGAESLSASKRLKALRRLELHHHYISRERATVLEIEMALRGVHVNLNDAQDEGRYGRYVSVSE